MKKTKWILIAMLLFLTSFGTLKAQVSELKFKVWNAEKREFVSDLTVKCSAIIVSNSAPELFASVFVFLTYTGVQDVDGQDIYVGDIVKYFSSVYKVIFREGLHVLHANDKEDVFFFNWDVKKRYTKIIGNIYENPELILGKDK